MPDKTLKTISASQMAGIFELSPYCTRRALFDHFHDQVDIEEDDNRRMDFGKFIQPHILNRTAKEYSLEITANEKDVYIRHKTLPIGTTLDAHLNCPTRGPGIVEAKSVSYKVWKEDWSGHKAPAHIEIQVQCQLLVTGRKWALIAVMVGANEGMHWLERYPDKEIVKQMTDGAKQFFDDVKRHRRPPANGHPMEMRGLDKLWPNAVKDRVIDLGDDIQVGELLRRYYYHREQRLFHSKNEDELKIRILDKAEDASRLIGYGAEAFITKTLQTASTVRKEEHIRKSIRVVESRDLPPLPEVGGFEIGA